MNRLTVIIAVCLMATVGWAQRINPLTQSMLDAYEQMLRVNPNDYMTLYERAGQYYRLDRYDMALSDIKRAVECTPAKEKAQLASEYSMMADIYTQLGEYPQALEAVNKGLALDQGSVPMLYMSGNINLHLNDMAGAKRAFQAMMRQQSRSQEAVLGLAKVAVMEQNYGLANEYIEQGEKLAAANYLTYCRIGDLHRDMHNSRQAAADYISAFCLSGESERPMRSMIDLARQDYDAALNAVDYALVQTQNSVPLHFLRGNMALTVGRYSDAYESFRHLLDSGAATDAQLATSMARVCLGMGNLQEADLYANRGVGATGSAQANLMKARVEEAAGNLASALIYADKAIRLDGEMKDAAIEEVVLLMAQGKNLDASEKLTAMIFTDPGNMEARLMRAWMRRAGRGDAPSAEADLNVIAGGNETDLRSIALRGMAKEMQGMMLDAVQVMEQVKKRAEKEGEAAYLMAVYSRLAGDGAKASEYKGKAQELGFEDAYMLKYSKHPVYSLSDVK